MKFSDKTRRLVLASASPRRRELLGGAGYVFDVIPADVDENAIKAKKPRSLVKRLASAKARAVYDNVGNAVVIGADTVVYRRKTYGKPVDCADAKRMLKELNGKTHAVYTGVCILSENGEQCFAVRSLVRFKKMTDGEIKRYVEECKPLDKAGAYGIQDKQVVGGYRGSYSNIVGLPVEKLTKILTKAGFANGNDRVML